MVCQLPTGFNVKTNGLTESWMIGLLQTIRGQMHQGLKWLNPIQQESLQGKKRNSEWTVFVLAT